MIGQTLAGQYEIVRQLGSGGMGAVYEARSKSDERVAIKVISTGDIAKDKALVGRFHREAKAATGIDTDHIVRVLATGTDETNDTPFMVMEYLIGEDLHHLFHRLGPLSPDLAMRIIAQAALGLGKAHDAHVVHRDIKPANIYLAERTVQNGGANPLEGTGAEGGQRIVKLLDFGIAKIKMDKANATDTTGLTRTGSMLGSPLYMSPEQARGSKSIDHRADIWSLGVVFYQALTGKTPNQDIDALGELIIAICSEAPRPVQELAPWVPPEIARILHKTLRFDPAERYQTSRELYEALAALLPNKNIGIHEAMLAPMTAEARAFKAEVATIPPAIPMARSGGGRNSMMPMSEGVPPSSVTSSPGTVRADGGTNAGLAQSPSTARPRTSSTKLPMLLGATALVGAGLAYVLYATMRPVTPPALAATAVVAEPLPTEKPSAEPVVNAAPEPAPKTVALHVFPLDAAVEVDGTRIVPKDGVVDVSGALGSTHTVRVWRGPAEKVQNIAITDSGPLPERVELEITGRTPPPTRAPGPMPKPGASVAPSAPSAPPTSAPAPAATFKDKFE